MSSNIYRIERIKELLKNNNQYSFIIREYADEYGYYSEVIVFYPVVSDTVGIIIERDTFNPSIYYKKEEVLKEFDRLQEKAIRIIKILRTASDHYNRYLI
jgi:hypothetical protein